MSVIRHFFIRKFASPKYNQILAWRNLVQAHYALVRSNQRKKTSYKNTICHVSIASKAFYICKRAIRWKARRELFPRRITWVPPLELRELKGWDRKHLKRLHQFYLAWYIGYSRQQVLLWVLKQFLSFHVFSWPSTKHRTNGIHQGPGKSEFYPATLGKG